MFERGRIMVWGYSQLDLLAPRKRTVNTLAYKKILDSQILGLNVKEDLLNKPEAGLFSPHRWLSSQMRSFSDIPINTLLNRVEGFVKAMNYEWDVS